MTDVWMTASLALLAGACIGGAVWCIMVRRMEDLRARLEAQTLRMQAHTKGWEQFTDKAVPLFPVLTRQLESVIADTECAAMNLGERFRMIAQKATALTSVSTRRGSSHPNGWGRLCKRYSTGWMAC